MRLCSYIVTHDTGLAPNPFWGVCTLALCTPNHMGIRAEPGDWFAGFTPVQRGDRLVYAMRVAEVLTFDDYYRDPRFSAKKPQVNGTWRERCGDNIYFRDESGAWQQHPTPFHTSPVAMARDLRRPRAFIGDQFVYFGSAAPPLPERFLDLIWRRQGCKCSHDARLVTSFITWLEKEFAPGIHGEPHDREADGCAPAPDGVDDKIEPGRTIP